MEVNLFPLSVDEVEGEENLSFSSDCVRRVLIVGDAGVGKSSIVNLLCQGYPSKPSSTVGCDVDAFCHQSNGFVYFIELYDVGGSPAFEFSRKLFYDVSKLVDSSTSSTFYDGIIGVYDVNNIRSRNNLDDWFREAIGLPHAHLDVLPWSFLKDSSHKLCIDLKLRTQDMELLSGVHSLGRRIPVLIIANKTDLQGAEPAPVVNENTKEDVWMSAKKELPPTTKRIISNFFETVIQEHYENHGRKSAATTPRNDQPIKLALTPQSSNKRSNHEVRLRIDFE